MYPVEPCRRKVKVAAASVFYFNIIFDNMVALNLFNPAVNTESVAFMYHVVTHGKLGKAADFLSFVMITLLLFPALFCAEHVAFCDDDKLDERIFKALVELSVCHKDFSRRNRPSGVLRAEGMQLVFPQIPGQTARSGTRSRQKYDTAAFLLPARQILDKQLKAVLIGIYIFPCQAVFPFYC